MPLTTAPTILYSHDTTRTPPDTARASDGDAPGRGGREWRVGRFRLILSSFVAGERLRVSIRNMHFKRCNSLGEMIGPWRSRGRPFSAD